MKTDERNKDDETLDLADFEYELPQHLIAQAPCPVRHQSKLLQLNRVTKALSHHIFSDLASLLNPSDLLVVNNTKVMPVRFMAKRATGGIIDLLLLKPEAGKEGCWQAMVAPIRRLRIGENLTIQGKSKQFNVKVADIITGEDGHKKLIVCLGSQSEVFELFRDAGRAPLPPYINRAIASTKEICDSGQTDLARYQTIFAAAPGAVAAPTAGLHFSDEVIENLSAKGISVCQLTLHVGPGTFKPINDSIEAHHIEPEEYSIPDETVKLVNSAKSQGRRIIAVGTTTCRALESAATQGILQKRENASTSLYIRPGFSFQIVDGLITNFHLSRSSLLLLVAAFAGHKPLMNAYGSAIENGYRFFSYGDCMLIL
jgi:S-adenosylmethionine:tRNA ribosyltransferase-isomerase